MSTHAVALDANTERHRLRDDNVFALDAKPLLAALAALEGSAAE